MTNDEKELVEEAWWENGPGVSVLREEASETAKPVYDLEERTARFGEAIVLFAKKVPHSPVNNRLIDQLVGAATVLGQTIAKRTMAFLARIS